MALARCAHSDKAGHKSAMDANHRAPAGMDKAILKRFVNPQSARAPILRFAAAQLPGTHTQPNSPEACRCQTHTHARRSPSTAQRSPSAHVSRRASSSARSATAHATIGAGGRRHANWYAAS